jgi:predicted nucleotide-binding protein (sugar kinase/HSP70/actin superfamily)
MVTARTRDRIIATKVDGAVPVTAGAGVDRGIADDADETRIVDLAEAHGVERAMTENRSHLRSRSHDLTRDWRMP